MSENTVVLYKENQKFTNKWIWLLVISAALFVWYGTVKQIIFHAPFGSRPSPDFLMIIIWIIFGIGMPLLFLLVRLTAEVRENGFYIRLFPFHLKFRKIPLEDIKNCETRTFNPLKDFGGWGIWFGSGSVTYTLKGCSSVQLEMTGGKKLLAGSGKPDEQAGAINSAIRKLSG